MLVFPPTGSRVPVFSTPEAQMVKDLTVMQKRVFDPWSGRSSREGNGNPL